MNTYKRPYAADGFVWAKSILSSCDVERLSDELPFVMDERRKGLLPSGLNVWMDSPAALRLATAPSILSIVAALLGDVNVRIWHDQAFIREPMSRGTPPHQDLPNWSLKTARAVTAWMPLSCPSITGGSMVYLRGSHHVGVLEPAGDIRKGEGWPLLTNPAVKCCKKIQIDTKVGDVLFHHPLLVHYTSDTSVMARLSYTVIYVAEPALQGYLGTFHSSRDSVIAVSPRVISRESASRPDKIEFDGER